jgi:hypothetical protein
MSTFLSSIGVDQCLDSQFNLQKKLFYYFCIVYHLGPNSMLFLLGQTLNNYSIRVNNIINKHLKRQLTKSKIFKLPWEAQKFLSQ